MSAVVAFAAAFYAAGAGQTTTKHVRAAAKVVPFTDTTAGSVAAGITGQPSALKLPPPRHVKHHAKPPAAVVTVPPAVTPAPAPVSTPPTAYVPPPAKHKTSGSGTGTTTVAPP